jgi:hypothetical protein
MAMINQPNASFRYQNTIVAGRIDSTRQVEEFTESITGPTGPIGYIGSSATGSNGPLADSATGPYLYFYHNNGVPFMFSGITYSLTTSGTPTKMRTWVIPPSFNAVNTGYTYDPVTGEVTIGDDGLYNISVNWKFRSNINTTELLYYVEKNPGAVRLNEDRLASTTAFAANNLMAGNTTFVTRLSVGDTLVLKIFSIHSFPTSNTTWWDNAGSTRWNVAKLN